jgi:hypothetical protein
MGEGDDRDEDEEEKEEPLSGLECCGSCLFLCDVIRAHVVCVHPDWSPDEWVTRKVRHMGGPCHKYEKHKRGR